MQAGLSTQRPPCGPWQCWKPRRYIFSMTTSTHVARLCSTHLACAASHRDPWREVLVPTLQPGKLKPSTVTWHSLIANEQQEEGREDLISMSLKSVC